MAASQEQDRLRKELMKQQERMERDRVKEEEERRREADKLDHERRKQLAKLQKERLKEEMKKQRELDKLRQAQERELKKLEQKREKEKKAEERRKQMEDRRRYVGATDWSMTYLGWEVYVCSVARVARPAMPCMQRSAGSYWCSLFAACLHSAFHAAFVCNAFSMLSLASLVHGHAHLLALSFLVLQGEGDAESSCSTGESCHTPTSA